LQRGTAKVDAARRLKGVQVVWLSWFTDSLALWTRQDETPYLLDDPSTKVVHLSSSPISEPNQISSDPEPDADDWDQETARSSNPGVLELNTINWEDINDEVEAAMNESDSEDEDTRSEQSGRKSGSMSEDDLTDDTASVTRCVLCI
jgi:RNA polymerase II subunit A C-terminal domain phosphatase